MQKKQGQDFSFPPLLLQNILNRNDKSEHITNLDNVVRIIIICQAASIRIFFFDRFGQYHSQERVTVQSFKKFLAKKRINALACSKILSNTST